MRINQALREALQNVYPADVVNKIEESGAYHAFKWSVGQLARAYGTPPADVLAALTAEDRDNATQADDPAVFLTEKVNALPAPW